MEDLKKSFLIHGSHIVGFSDKNFSTAPLGTVLSFAGQTAPHGYLLCDGASYKVADYPHLYAVIGNTYGGDTENFNVPNLVDKFIQGSTASGTEKEAGLPNIEGQIGNESDSHAIFYAPTTNGAFTPNKKAKLTGGGSSSGDWYASASFDASKSNAIYGNSDTVQPPALTMVYIIKAFHTNEGVDSGVSDDVVEYVDNKVETELKTSENTDIIYVTLTGDDTFESMGDTYCKYQVKNGICYFQFFVASSVATDTFTEIYNGLPKPIFSQYFSYPVYYNSQGLNKTLQVNISEGGLLTAANALPTTSYMIVGSYPIA